MLHQPAALEKVGTGTLCVLSEGSDGKVYGRSLTVADRLGEDRVIIAKWVRRLTNWNGRQAPLAVWQEKIAPLRGATTGAAENAVVRFVNAGAQDRRPGQHRRSHHCACRWIPTASPCGNRSNARCCRTDCAHCSLVPVCRELSTATGTAMLWRRLGLVDAAGVPTLRGRVVSFFSQGDGLAIAAALEDGELPAR